MSTNYRRKLLLYFAAIFFIFTIGVVLLEQSREREYKTEALEEKLDAYADVAHRMLEHNDESPQTFARLMKLLPDNIRLTQIDDNGAVLYDNVIDNVSRMENHARRPEIIAASKHHKGKNIRISSSNNTEYLYYAKRFDRCYIRVALPYDIQVRRFLKTDRLFLYYIAALFTIMLFFINYAAGKSGKSMSREIALEQEKNRLLKQEMTGNITHELRTPVTGIRGCLETVLEHRLSPEKKRHFIRQAYNQTVVLSELIQDMSLITKIEDAPQSFRIEQVNIMELLKELKNDLAIPLREKNIDLRENMTDDVIVQGNRNLIYSIFRNLTENVIRHAGSNITVKIAKYRESKNFYWFSYADNGAGIPDIRHLSRLFERFYRINEGRTRDTGGSGLGLSIVKNAVVFHKGTIAVRNHRDGGLEFLFQLPKVSGVFAAKPQGEVES
ncbi:MAG: HAMP domain-containing histidine kinase [Bacteroidales bacterium]|jgi:signal transduction histidine kinase|nr:HAMP domain-containing histidine kinase [Bacteroidales bacterium]